MDHNTASPPTGDFARPEPHPFTLALRRRRVERTLSQKRLARISGVSEAWIRLLEQGTHRTGRGRWKQSLPNPEHTVRLARALDWDVQDALRTVGYDPEVIPVVEMDTLDERIGRLTPREAKLVELVLDRVLQGTE